MQAEAPAVVAAPHASTARSTAIVEPRGRFQKEPPRVAFETLTEVEAAWHAKVLCVYAGTSLFLVAWAAGSAAIGAVVSASFGVLVTAGFLTFPLVTKGLRAQALMDLQHAVAGGNGEAVRASIQRAQACGITAREAASARGLQTALRSRLQASFGDALTAPSGQKKAQLCRGINRESELIKAGCKPPLGRVSTGKEPPTEAAKPALLSKFCPGKGPRPPAPRAEPFPPWAAVMPEASTARATICRAYGSASALVVEENFFKSADPLSLAFPSTEAEGVLYSVAGIELTDWW